MKTKVTGVNSTGHGIVKKSVSLLKLALKSIIMVYIALLFKEF